MGTAVGGDSATVLHGVAELPALRGRVRRVRPVHGRAANVGEMTPGELKQKRAALGLSQGQLARVLGVHRQTVSKWERGIYPIFPWLPLALDGLLQARNSKPPRSH